jgi:polygalacturonase
MSYGADPRGRELSTLAMQRAIDACTLSGGGTVVVPPGRYRIATITIKNNVTLQFEKETFVDAPRLYSQYSPYNSLIRASGSTNVALRGPVIINGQGTNYWNVVPNPNPFYTVSQNRPVPIVQFLNCSNVVVDGITILYSPSWALSPYSSTNVTIRNVTILNDFAAPNTDGIDICQSKDVLVTGCRIATADDPISIKNMEPTVAANLSRNITITNCDLISPYYSFRIGSESRVGIVENIVFTDCFTHANGTNVGMHSGFALECVDGGTLRNVRISRIRSENARAPVFIRLGSRNTSPPTPTGPGIIQDVLIEDVSSTVVTSQREFGIEIHGIPTALITNVTIRNFTMIPRGGVKFSNLGVTNIADLVVLDKETSYPSADMFGWLPGYGVYCRHTRGLTLQNVNILPLLADVRPTVAFDDVDGLSISNLVTSFPGTELRTGPSLWFATNSPSITISAVTNSAVPPGGWILSTP